MVAMKKENQLKKKQTLYSLQKITNSVVKWTAIISFYCNESGIDTEGKIG